MSEWKLVENIETDLPPVNTWVIVSDKFMEDYMESNAPRGLITNLLCPRPMFYGRYPYGHVIDSMEKVPIDLQHKGTFFWGLWYDNDGNTQRWYRMDPDKVIGKFWTALTELPSDMDENIRNAKGRTYAGISNVNVTGDAAEEPGDYELPNNGYASEEEMNKAKGTPNTGEPMQSVSTTVSGEEDVYSEALKQ